MTGDFLAEFADPLICAARHETGEIGAHTPDRWRNRHVVVIENDDQASRGLRCVVHRLVGHAGAHRAVADHGNDAVVLAAQIAGDAEAQGGGYRCRGVGGPEWVVGAFGALGEPREAVSLAQRADAVSATGKNLVRIGLVADIPDDNVARRIKDVVQGDSELDYAKTSAKMSARLGYRVDRLGA